jgi:transposase
MVAKLAKGGAKLHFCYEAGPTGYDLHRQIIGLGHDGVVVAPSLVPRRPGDRVKTNRRDAVSLARLHRAGELTAVWVPDAAHEAMRGIAFMTAVTFVVEIGDVRRFDNPRQLMAYQGLVPSESSTGERVKRGSPRRATCAHAGSLSRAPGPIASRPG